MGGGERGEVAGACEGLVEEDLQCAAMRLPTWLLGAARHGVRRTGATSDGPGFAMHPGGLSRDRALTVAECEERCVAGRAGGAAGHVRDLAREASADTGLRRCGLCVRPSTLACAVWGQLRFDTTFSRVDTGRGVSGRPRGRLVTSVRSGNQCRTV